VVEVDPQRLALLAETDARLLLAGRPLVLRMLVPHFPALGVGVLRVLRVNPGAGDDAPGVRYELTVGYERYERRRAALPT
jgi:hypothetical protein